MMAGTTEPGPSEDLWAQVATTQLGGRTQWRSSPAADVVVYGTESTREPCGGMAGSALTSTALRKAPHPTARCLMLEAVPWENPTYGISGRAAGNVAYGGIVLPRCNRKGGDGNPPPKGARASALPDTNWTEALRCQRVAMGDSASPQAVTE